MFNTPVLLITFNRPEHTEKVLSSILEMLPRRLYIFQDGVRNEHDKTKCEEVKNLIDGIDEKKCGEIIKYYAQENLGCGRGPQRAIDWFFEREDMGIIIEDDAVPHRDFYTYCEELLIKYKNRADVRAIGSVHIGNKHYGDGSYYFSMMNRILCAWATWRRAWVDFDYRMLDVSREQLNSALLHYGCSLRMREYWCDRLDEIHKDAYNDSSWDQQFWMSIWLHKGKGIVPNVNLSTNIGFDEHATHTTNVESVAANLGVESILPLQAPRSEDIVKCADELFQRLYFAPYEYGWSGFLRWPHRLNKRIKRLVGKKGPWIKNCKFK